MDNDNYDYPYENFEYVESYAGLPVSRGFQHGHHNNHHHQQPFQQQNQNNQYQYHQFNHHHHQHQPQQQYHQHQQEDSDHYQVHQVNNSNHMFPMDPTHLHASGISAIAGAGSSPSSIISNNSISTSHSTVSTFTNLAKTVNVKLPKSLTK